MREHTNPVQRPPARPLNSSSATLAAFLATAAPALAADPPEDVEILRAVSPPPQIALPILAAAAPVPVPQGDPIIRSAPVGGLLSSFETVREDWREGGLDVWAILATEGSRVLEGGLRQENSFRALADLGLDADLERLFGLRGGVLSAVVQGYAGDPVTFDVGSVQPNSSLDNFENFVQVSELWYEQLLFSEVLRLKLGKVDANSEFAFVKYGGEFVHSSMGVSPTIFVMPTYPDPAVSLNLFLEPADWAYLGAGFYDGATHAGFSTGGQGPSTFLGGPSDSFWIGELGGRWGTDPGQYAGRLGLGAWHHTGDFERFDGGIEDGTSGLYLVLDQQLGRSFGEDDHGTGAFLQLGWADEAVSEMTLHLGLGLHHQGGLGGRARDSFGLGLTHVELTDLPGAGFDESSETAFELFYRWQPTDWLMLKPDLQYVHNPGGDSAVDDAIVAAVRAEIGF